MFAPRFLLILPADADSDALAGPLAAVLATRTVEAVLVGAARTDDRAELARCKALIAVVQAAGVAALLDAPADPRAVARTGADGAHYPYGHPALADAIETLKPQRILGIGNLRTKHEAMETGEANIDYLMFGEPRADGFVPETEKTAERAAWWAEIFNVPCVAYAAGVDGVAIMAATHADFIALGPWLFDGDASANLRAAMKACAPLSES